MSDGEAKIPPIRVHSSLDTPSHNTVPYTLQQRYLTDAFSGPDSKVSILSQQAAPSITAEVIPKRFLSYAQTSIHSMLTLAPLTHDKPSQLSDAAKLKPVLSSYKPGLATNGT
jgi:hypothetical protein